MRALVTGGAGLIGSHIADLLIREGWLVRILDNLEPQTHRNGRPSWIPATAEFIEADIRDRAATAAVLRDIDVVFHEAAYGGYRNMAWYFPLCERSNNSAPEISQYTARNVAQKLLPHRHLKRPRLAGKPSTQLRKSIRSVWS